MHRQLGSAGRCLAKIDVRIDTGAIPIGRMDSFTEAFGVGSFHQVDGASAESR